MQHRFDRTDTQHHRTRRAAAELGLDFALQVEQLLGIDEEAAPRDRDTKALAVTPVDQRRTELALQRGDAARHRRLREMQLVGRARHALERDDPEERLDEAQVQWEPCSAVQRSCTSDSRCTTGRPLTRRIASAYGG